MINNRAYVICTSPRSGSTLLCQLLAATGVAGKPASYFFDPSVEDWLEDLGITANANLTAQARLHAAIQAAVHAGRNGTQIFGLRQQSLGRAFLCEQLAALYPNEINDSARFKQAFGPTKFIHLQRPDKLAQAISYLKAQQSGLWHRAHDGTEMERLAPHRAPQYDGNQLQALIKTLKAEDNDWNQWFAREGITPLRLSYNYLAANPLAVLRNVLGYLELSPSAADGITVGVKKLADRESSDWAARYQAEGRQT